jgi:hypothetical protein
MSCRTGIDSSLFPKIHRHDSPHVNAPDQNWQYGVALHKKFSKMNINKHGIPYLFEAGSSPAGEHLNTNQPFPARHPVLEFADQCASDLVFAITEQELTVPVKVLAQAQFSAAGLAFTFSIIGESHIVRVERDGALLMQEVLACIPVEPGRCTHLARFPVLTNHTYMRPNYTASVNFYQTDSVLEAPFEAQEQGRLRYAFPQSYGRTPQTVVLWYTDPHKPNALGWRTLHSYPEVGGVRTVLTESTFDLRTAESIGHPGSSDPFLSLIDAPHLTASS